MITNKRELIHCLELEKNNYILKKRIDHLLAIVTRDYVCEIWNYIKFLRHSEYHFNNCSKKSSKKSLNSIYHDICFVYYHYKKNKLGKKLQLEIYENNFGEGLTIYHTVGGVLVNGSARIGCNCKLHGSNCIGNKGYNNKVPTIGNNVDIGYGASIIGDVYIGDNTVIAAGAVVVNSFPEGNVCLAGIPAKIIKRYK